MVSCKILSLTFQLAGGNKSEHIPKNGMFDDLTDIELCIPLEWGSNCAPFLGGFKVIS